MFHAPCYNSILCLSALAAEYGERAVLLELNTVQLEELSLSLGVQSLPYFQFYSGGQRRGDFAGSKWAAVKDRIVGHLGPLQPATAEPSPPVDAASTSGGDGPAQKKARTGSDADAGEAVAMRMVPVLTETVLLNVAEADAVSASTYVPAGVLIFVRIECYAFVSKGHRPPFLATYINTHTKNNTYNST